MARLGGHYRNERYCTEDGFIGYFAGAYHTLPYFLRVFLHFIKFLANYKVLAFSTKCLCMSFMVCKHSCQIKLSRFYPFSYLF